MAQDTKAVRTKRPYEQPRLEPSAVFGAEAMWGSCCRGSGVTCTNTTRNTRRTTIDPNKARNVTVS
ncbi:MAG: hypothetical protein ACE147_00465 [Candidatus Methylomirabilales bacterium]